jgi:hypothetical protein
MKGMSANGRRYGVTPAETQYKKEEDTEKEKEEEETKKRKRSITSLLYNGHQGSFRGGGGGERPGLFFGPTTT